MIIVKCDNCKRDMEVGEDTIMTLCRCGFMVGVDIEVKGGKKKDEI